MSIRLLHPHPLAPVLQRLPGPSPPRRASRLHRWQFTPHPSRLQAVSTSTLVAPSSSVLLSSPHTHVRGALEPHPRWHPSTFGPVPGPGPVFRRRQQQSRPPGHSAIPSRTAVATRYMMLQAARRRLARRHGQPSHASRSAPVPLAGTSRYHDLPFGQQPSTLFDVAVPWAERVVASDSLLAEFTGYVPSHLQPQRSRACYSKFGYTSDGHVVRYDDPYSQQLHPDDGLDYL